MENDLLDVNGAYFVESSCWLLRGNRSDNMQSCFKHRQKGGFQNAQTFKTLRVPVLTFFGLVDPGVICGSHSSCFCRNPMEKEADGTTSRCRFRIAGTVEARRSAQQTPPFLRLVDERMDQDLVRFQSLVLSRWTDIHLFSHLIFMIQEKNMYLWAPNSINHAAGEFTPVANTWIFWRVRWLSRKSSRDRLFFDKSWAVGRMFWNLRPKGQNFSSANGCLTGGCKFM